MLMPMNNPPMVDPLINQNKFGNTINIGKFVVGQNGTGKSRNMVSGTFKTTISNQGTVKGQQPLSKQFMMKTQKAAGDNLHKRYFKMT